MLVTSIDVPPCSYVLSLGEPLDHLLIGDITELADVHYDDERDLRFALLCGLGHVPYPLDYRSTARINMDDEAGKKNITVGVKAVKSDGTVVN